MQRIQPVHEIHLFKLLVRPLRKTRRIYAPIREILGPATHPVFFWSNKTEYETADNSLRHSIGLPFNLFYNHHHVAMMLASINIFKKILLSAVGHHCALCQLMDILNYAGYYASVVCGVHTEPRYSGILFFFASRVANDAIDG